MSAAGAGFAHFDFDIEALDLFGGQVPIGADQSETKLALKGIVGANLALGYHFGLGARYSYIWANTATDKTKSATFSGIPIKGKGEVGDFTAGNPVHQRQPGVLKQRHSGRFTRAQGRVSPGAWTSSIAGWR